MAFFKYKQVHQELGFGNKEYKNKVRFLSKNGTVNIKRRGLGLFKNLDVYHWLISTSSLKLNLTILIGYIIINSLFAFIYSIIGAQNFGGLDVSSGKTAEEFLALFFFSAQTITTLGYGHVYPIGSAASTAAAIESLMGLLSFAVATGILYGRFSKPVAHVLYSKNLLIAPYREGQAIMFRLVNKKQSELIESEVKVSVSFNNQTNNKREFYNLKLEIEKINFFALNWTVVHPLDAESPISEIAFSEYEKIDIEFMILFKAINDTVSQNVYSRNSYKTPDIINKAKFLPVSQNVDRKGRLSIIVNEIHSYETLD